MLTQNLKKYLLPALLAAALVVSLVKPAEVSIQSVAQKIQSRISDAETTFYNSLSNKNFAEQLSQGKLPGDKKREGQIFYFYYLRDSLVAWTNNCVLPSHSPSSFEESTSLIKLKNGWYLVMKKDDTLQHTSVLGLLPVRYAYPFENKLLQNDFALGVQVPDNILLSNEKIEGSVEVKNLEGKTLFSLYTAGEKNAETISWLLLLAQLVVLFLLFYYVQLGSIYLLNHRSFAASFVFLVSVLIIMRGIMLIFNWPGELNKLPLFDPKYYASSILTKSLGDLMLNALLLVWIVFFFNTHYRKKPGDALRPQLLKLTGLLFVFLYTAFILWVFKTLVMDSVISFEIYNVLSLNLYSLFGLLCLALIMLIHFLLTRAVLLSLLESTRSNLIVVAFTVVFGLVFAATGLNTEFYEAIYTTALWVTAAILLLYFLFRRGELFSIRNILVYIALYSLISTFLIENLYERKERNGRSFFSGKLVSERDYVAEYMFNDIAKRISSDPFIAQSFSNPVISQREVTDRINVLYLGGYFNKYNLQVYSLDASGSLSSGEDSTQLAIFHPLQSSDMFRNTGLNYISDSAHNYSYISFLPFYSDSVYTGSLVLRLVPKIYYGQNVYPELLLGSSLTVSNNANNYSYAIYQNDKLIAQYGDYPYSYYWNHNYKFDGEDFRFIEEKDWELSIQRFINGKKAIVAVQREPLFEPVATFSYFFTFYFLVLSAVVIIYRSVTAQDIRDSLYGSLIVSFRTRINFSMLLMILISFIIIGIITINFFSRQYDNFYTDRLLRKEKVVHASLEYFVQKNNTANYKFSNELDFEIAHLADINTIDINLFDRQGNLMISSQPIIYDKGILSRKMNPHAYFELENNKTAQVVENENIGRLNYQATYTPLRNGKGEAVAYLGIPHFERAKNISDEVSSFLVALMNVYVFLLICAAILAYFISNSITRPLTIISEKLRILNLNKRNEPIEWNSKDEIGVLVSEYNKMINELERSAQKLAKGERESAWREMAKQIAHEIKNPLTPMKLSIQYLQRAIDEGNPNIEQMARKVARTLEEQIENLSSIATAFSSFAKMPKAYNEIINLNDLLKSIAELFGNEEKASISFASDSASPLVFADKNQLVSVFNNIVKNAIQSIPEHRKGFIDIHIKEEDGWIIASVSDNGSGIPKDNYDKVFVPNFTTKSSGTGLGLAITKQIIEGSGGTIWFDSAENIGTTFYIRLLKSAA